MGQHLEKCQYCSYSAPDGCYGNSSACDKAIERMMKVQQERIQHQNSYTQNKNINISQNTKQNKY